MAKVLVKTDKNGTKWFTDDVCSKCDGKGVIPYYSGIYNGVCFLCSGSGKHTSNWKEYTPEYNQVLANKREAKLEAKREVLRKEAYKRNIKFFDKAGFDFKGNTWIVLGSTYNIKEQIKLDGGKYSQQLGWHFDNGLVEYKTMLVNIQDLCEVNDIGDYEQSYSFKQFEIAEKVKAMKASFTEVPSTSTHVGNIGDKLTLTVDLISSFSRVFQISYRQEVTSYIHKMVDSLGNVYIWKTGTEFGEEKKVVLTGTVKEHSEYNKEKQTALTRCKVLEILR